MRPLRTIAAAFAAALLASSASAQQKTEAPYSVVLSAYPLSFFISTMKLGSEFALVRKTSLFVSGGLTSREHSNFYGVNDVTELLFEVQPRFYLNTQERSLNGFFTAPYVSYRSMSFSDARWDWDPFEGMVYTPEGNFQASAFTLGYLIGVQLIARPGVVFGLSAGGGMAIPSGEYTRLDDPFNFYGRGISPRFSYWLGIAL